MATIAIGLSLSSPNTSEVAAQLSRFPQSSSANPNDDFTVRPSVQQLPSTAEKLAAIQSTFGLNKSQLATACSVKRQTIYDWYAGNFEAEGSNADRLAALYRLVTTIRRSGLQPVSSKSADKSLANGESLLELLGKDDVSHPQVLAAVQQLQSHTVPTESARDQRERLGWEPLMEEQRESQLQSNLDSFLDG
jgi:DNA-binding XRE family transcriptional regulator